MIPKIQKKVERETKIIRKEMNMRGTPLDFIFEGKTPNVTGTVAGSYEYPLLSRQGYRVESTRRMIGEENFDWEKRWPDHYREFESKDVFYIPGIKCCGSGDKHVPAVLNVLYSIRHNNGSSCDDEKRIFALNREPLKVFMDELEKSEDMTRNISAEILREIIAGGRK